MEIGEGLNVELFERVFDLWGLILEKFGGFDLFVVYLNENCS